MPAFRQADQRITHLLFMKKWDSNFIFNELKNGGKAYIEKLVTPGWPHEQPPQAEDESSLALRKQVVSSVYKNFQQIM